MRESPAFTRTHDLVAWLLRATHKFPREQRFVLARRIQDRAFALQDAIIAAQIDKSDARKHLIQADIALVGLRKGLLLAYQMSLLTPGQYQHISRLDTELGRILGGWQRNLRGPHPP